MGFWKICRQNKWLWGMLAGAVLLGVGAGCGELAAIWEKAVMICMECIGLG